MGTARVEILGRSNLAHGADSQPRCFLVLSLQIRLVDWYLVALAAGNSEIYSLLVR